jgi:hypothetical protein
VSCNKLLKYIHGSLMCMLVAVQIESMKWSFHEGRGAMAHLGHKVAPPMFSTELQGYLAPLAGACLALPTPAMVLPAEDLGTSLVVQGGGGAPGSAAGGGAPTAARKKHCRPSRRVRWRHP